MLIRIVLLTFAAAFTIFAAPPNPVHWILESVPGKPLKAGAHFAPKLVATIDEGWHLYALDEPDGTANPTEITLAEDSPLTLGAIRASKPTTLLDPNFGKPASFYTGKAEFALPLQVPTNTAPGQTKLTIKIRYQSCSATTCLAPKTTSVNALLTIR